MNFLLYNKNYSNYVFIYGLIYSALWYILRPLGAVVLLGIVILCLVCIFTPINLKRISPYVKNYVFFISFSLICVAFSYIDLFPNKHKMFFDSSVILQQVIGFILFPFFTFFFVIYCFDRGNNIFKVNNVIVVLFFCYLVFSVLGYLYSDNYNSLFDSFKIGTLVNAELIALFFIMGYIFNLNLNNWVKVMFTMSLIIFSGSSQSLISVVVAVILFFIRSHVFLRMFVFCLFLAVLMSLYFPNELYFIDANTGVRAMFWDGALSDLVKSFGLGIGFGTEAIAPEFYVYTDIVRVVTPDIDYFSYMTTATHNTFFDVLQRTGVIGLILFSSIVVRFIFNKRISQFDAWVTSTLILTFTVNVALSITFLFGTCILMGWLEYRLIINKEENEFESLSCA